MEEKLCINCMYFRQHYVKVRFRFTPIYHFGACRHTRHAGSLKVCKHYIQKDIEAEKQIDKDLAVDLLNDVLSRVNGLLTYLKN